MEYFYGKTVEDAINEGLSTLGVNKEDCIISVLDEGNKGGLFGIGATKAKVGIEIKENNKNKVVKFLEGLFEYLEVNATCEVKEEDGKIVIDIISTNSSKIIGYRGEVLDSLQTLATAFYNTDKENYQRVVVDCENYREKRKETLTSLAKRKASDAVKKGKKVFLEPMNPYERRIIHSALTDFEGVKTESFGEEPQRHIVIIPDNLKPFEDKKGYKKDKFSKNKEEKPQMIKSTKKTSGFGTYLGNSLKND